MSLPHPYTLRNAEELAEALWPSWTGSGLTGRLEAVLKVSAALHGDRRFMTPEESAKLDELVARIRAEKGEAA